MLLFLSVSLVPTVAGGAVVGGIVVVGATVVGAAVVVGFTVVGDAEWSADDPQAARLNSSIPDSAVEISALRRLISTIAIHGWFGLRTLIELRPVMYWEP